jgi:hypothetical protein
MKEIPPPPRSLLKSTTALERAAHAHRSRGVSPVGEVWLRTEDAAAHLKVSVSSLTKWRVWGRGPPYAKLIGTVVYALKDLDDWASAKKRSSTSETVTGDLDTK